MTAIRLDRPADVLALPRFRGRSPGVLALAAAQAGRWLRNRRAERRMAAMSDDQLRDIGVTRADIARVVRHGRG